MKRIQSKDTVIVRCGKDKGHVAKVKLVQGDYVLVEGANLKTKHVKANPNLQQEGGLVKKEAKIHVSNVAIYNPQSQKADKVGFKFIEKEGEKKKVRYFKSSQELIDLI